VNLRDELNDALARQAAGIHVFSTKELRAVVKQSHVSTGMIYSNAMMYWIASHAHADAVVAIQIDSLKDGRAAVTAQLSEGKDLQAEDLRSHANVPAIKFEGQMILTPEEIELAAHEYQAPLSVPAAMVGKNLVGMPTCVQCPRPGYSERGRTARFHGTIYLLATVQPDGTADDVMITSPIGLGLDSLSVDTLLNWKFKPAVDSQGRPMATRVSIEMAFALN
jgi:TonB-like protein